MKTLIKGIFIAEGRCVKNWFELSPFPSVRSLSAMRAKDESKILDCVDACGWNECGEHADGVEECGKFGAVGTDDGSGGSEVTDGSRKIVERIRKYWLHLQPGEFLVFTGDARLMLDKTEGLITYEYWAEYGPPRLSDAEKVEAVAAGCRVPDEPVVSAHLTYTERWPVEE